MTSRLAENDGQGGNMGKMNRQGFRWMAVAAAATIYSQGFAHGGLEDWPYAEFPMPRPAKTEPKSTLRPASAGPINADFSGGLSGWNVVARVELLPNGGPGGIPALRTSGQNWVTQQFAFDIPTWQTLTVRLFAKPEFAGQSTPIYLEATGPTLREHAILIPRNGLPLSAEWQATHTAFTRQPGADNLLMVLRPRVPDWWHGVADVAFLFEGIANGGFGAFPGDGPQRWITDGSVAIEEDEAFINGRAVVLRDGASISQWVAHSPNGVHYFVGGVAAGTIILEEERLGRTGSAVQTPRRTTTIELEVRSQFLWEPDQSPTADGARLVLSNGDEQPATIEWITRGWTVAWPEVFEPVPNSPIPTVRLAAALPSGLEAASISIIDAEGNERALLDDLTRDGTTIWIEYDGESLPDGVYTARFQLTGSEGSQFVPERRFTLRRGAPFPAEPSPIRFGEFQATPWLFFDDGPADAAVVTVDRAAEVLQIVKDDGFNLATIICPPGRLATFVEAAERVDLPFVLGSPPAWIPLPSSVGNQTFDPRLYRDVLEQTYGPFLDHPLMRGIMLADEVNVWPSLGRDFLKASIYLEREGFPPSFTYLGGSSAPGNFLPSIHTAHSYGFDFEQIRRHFEDWHQPVAVVTGRDFWFGIQGYTRVGGPPAPTAAMTSALLGTGLAIGARGHYSFLYTTLNQIGGIRTVQFEETSRTAAYRDFNFRARALSPLLLDLPQTREAPSQSNVFVRIGRDTSGRAHAFLVNQLESQEVAVMITTSGAPFALNAESGELVDLAEPFLLGPGQWQVLSFPVGVEPEHFEGTAGPRAPRQHASLQPITNFATPVGPSRALAVSPDSRFLSTISGPNWYLYDMQPSQSAPRLLRTAFLGTAMWSTTRFVDARTVIQGTNTMGLDVWVLDELGETTPLIRRERVTTGGHAAVQVGPEEWWVTQSFIGLSRVRFEPGDLFGMRQTHWTPRHYGFVSLHGPLIDGSVIGVDHIHGPYRLALEGDQFTGQRLEASSIWAPGATSRDLRRLAFGRLDRGLIVYTLTPEGGLTSQRISHATSEAMELTEWITPDVVAVVDRREGVLFFRILREDAAQFLGKWQAPVGEARTVAAADGGLVVIGTSERDVYVLDATPMLNLPPTGWVFVGETHDQSP